jgi:hypothetical protein
MPTLYIIEPFKLFYQLTWDGEAAFVDTQFRVAAAMRCNAYWGTGLRNKAGPLPSSD